MPSGDNGAFCAAIGRLRLHSTKRAPAIPVIVHYSGSGVTAFLQGATKSTDGCNFLILIARHTGKMQTRVGNQLAPFYTPLFWRLFVILPSLPTKAAGAPLVR
jgi:hypothetical protein